MTGKIYPNFFKRIFDIVCSLVGLVLTAPLLLLLATWIKLESPGPVFYRGLRGGRYGHAFRIFKFRSMVVDGEQRGPASTADDDRRITRSGQFIRRYKLDELAQLISVLTGEMSIVGPRPDVLEEIELFSDAEKIILTVRPGITDYASIKFHNEGEILRGQPDPHLAYQQLIRPEKRRLQLRYIEECSWLTDLKIIFDTLKTIIKG